MGERVLDIRGVIKDYRGLRPLRIERLTLERGESLALRGLDAVAAEVLVNLITGATVPDAGEIALFGQLTSAVTDGDAWLASLDRVGILSARAVLLDSMSAAQNLAVPFSLALTPIPPDVRLKVDALAEEVGLSPADLERPVGDLEAAGRLLVRFGRALALAPDVVLAEHANAMVEPVRALAFASVFRRVVGGRQCASLTLSADREFAAATAERVLMLNAATGELRPESVWRRWF